MKVKILLILFISFSSIRSFAQQGLKWEEINHEWNLNSANYPENEKHLDSLYYKLMKFKLILANDNSFKMIFPKDSIVQGQYELEKDKKIIVFSPIDNKRKITYHILELNREHFSISSDEKLTWAYYLSLTSHQ